EDAVVPEEKRTDRVWLRPLSGSDVELDYDAVMGSAEQLRRWSQTSWPADDFTLAENLADLERHEREHLERVAFTYTVMNPQGDRCLGCVYITPLMPQAGALCAGASYPAKVGFWARTSELANDLDAHLLATLRTWFAAEWAFDCIVWLVSPQDERQATLARAQGMERLADIGLSHDRTTWAFQ
ncbi:MAG TPA: hypothetical protein VFX76_19070, partial [Roseiflexaceae bacterium]|nr:hypothetical protein [Roseiflexaceae bacterium]